MNAALVDGGVDVAETSCQVCGAPSTGELVECVKCSNLHHRDCWDYNGRCSTFDCGSLSSRKAAMKGPEGR